MIYTSILERTKNKIKLYRKYFDKVKKQKYIDLDQQFYDTHQTVFKKIDCLLCANCCKNISPIVTISDIKKIAKNLKIKENNLIDQYLILDEDEDYIFKQTPCPFLDKQNYCSIYEFRPNACKEYPHTDRKKIRQIIDITIKNIEYCPAVAEICDYIYNKSEENKK